METSNQLPNGIAGGKRENCFGLEIVGSKLTGPTKP
jgi:hypothetical protein